MIQEQNEGVPQHAESLAERWAAACEAASRAVGEAIGYEAQGRVAVEQAWALVALARKLYGVDLEAPDGRERYAEIPAYCGHCTADRAPCCHQMGKRLANQIMEAADLRHERDEYDKRRRAAMEKAEEWREKHRDARDRDERYHAMVEGVIGPFRMRRSTSEPARSDREELEDLVLIRDLLKRCEKVVEPARKLYYDEVDDRAWPELDQILAWMVGRMDRLPNDSLGILRERLNTQDNRATKYPLYCVQQERRIYGVEAGLYAKDYGWSLVGDDAVPLLSPEDFARSLEVDYGIPAHSIADMVQEDEVEFDGNQFERIYYIAYWEFVTAHLTEAAADAYIEQNRHNLENPRVYVTSQHRCWEWIDLIDGIRSGTIGDVDGPVAAGDPAPGCDETLLARSETLRHMKESIGGFGIIRDGDKCGLSCRHLNRNWQVDEDCSCNLYNSNLERETNADDTGPYCTDECLWLRDILSGNDPGNPSKKMAMDTPELNDKMEKEIILCKITDGCGHARVITVDRSAAKDPSRMTDQELVDGINNNPRNKGFTAYMSNGILRVDEEV